MNTPYDASTSSVVVPPEDTRPAGQFLGWSFSSLPVTPLLAVGLALGPQGLNLLTSSALPTLDPALSVAFAALGALLGLDIELPRHQTGRLLIRGLASAGLTATLVGLGVYGAAALSGLITLPPALAALIGVCAASSMSMPGRASAAPQHVRLSFDAERLWSIVTAAWLIGVVAGGSSLSLAGRLLAGIGIALVLGATGWLLVRDPSSPTERRVFVLATLLLIGGAADTARTSPLLAGLVAGVLWRRLGGPSQEGLANETRYAQHPFAALVLIVAGALVTVTPVTVGLACTYGSLRIAGRFLIGWPLVDGRWNHASDDFVRPGLLGVALALAMMRALDADALGVGHALSIIVIGTIVGDIVVHFLLRSEARA